MLNLSKSTTALRGLIISSCIFSLIFVSGFNFENFTNSSHGSYAAEITCNSPSKSLNCTDGEQIDQILFRGHPDEPTQVKDYIDRTVSVSFAKFIGVFIRSTDNFRMVILKTYLIKALLATYLLFSVLIYLRKFKDLKNLSSQLVLLFFSSAYFLSAITSVYPTGLTTVASLSSLIIFKIFIENYIISKKMKTFLCLNFFISSLIIVSNRFETTCYVLLCFFVFIVFGTNKTKFFERLKLASAPALMFATAFTIIWIASEFFRAFLTEALHGNFVIMTPVMYENSEMIKQFGRWAVAAQAPYTLLDNTIRISSYRTIQGFFEEHFDFAGPYIVVMLQYILIVSFLVPGMLIFFNALVKNLKPFLSYKKFDRSERKSQLGSLFIIFNMVLIPFIAFTPWFIWYIMPLLFVYLFFASAFLNSGRVLKNLFLIIFVTNSLTYYIYNDQLGSIYISSFIVRPLLLDTLFTVAALVLWFQVPRFVNSD